MSRPLLEERLEGPVEASENLLSCLRVEFPQQRVPPPLGGENPALLAVRGGEPLLLPAPLPVAGGAVPIPPRPSSPSSKPPPRPLFPVKTKREPHSLAHHN